MHVIHPDPRRLLAAAGATLVLMLGALALPPAAGELDLRLGGDAPATGEPAPALVRSAPSDPRWVADPVSPPAFAPH